VKNRFAAKPLASVLAVIAVIAFLRPAGAENLNTLGIDSALGRSGQMQAGFFFF
jgi:hypothetical protein